MRPEYHLGADIGQRIRGIRKARGHTQRAAAELANVHVQYLSDLERGRVANPSVATLTRLAGAYGIGVDELLGHGRPYAGSELPQSLRELLADPDWGAQITASWIETLMGVGHEGRKLQTKQEFLEAFLALRRILQ